MMPPSLLRPRSLGYALLCATLACASFVRASAQTPDPDAQQHDQTTPAAKPGDPDGQVVGDPPLRPRTPAQLQDQAWTTLKDAASDPKHSDNRIQALAALGLLGGNPRSLTMIEDAMSDPDVDVRTAAVLAAGQTKAPAITPAVRRLLNDKEPQVAFNAALALWKIGDHSGEDILMAVVDGERRASATLINGTEHDMDKTLHSPSEMAKIGVTEGAGLLLGPFGFGITAYEYIHKNGGSSARVSAIEALSQEKSEPLRKELVAALKDKDLGVRAAAAKALDSYHQPEVSAAIAKLFDDPKQPVRLTASAAYLVSTGASPASPKPQRRRSSHK
jgi:HEAT repeat protein